MKTQRIDINYLRKAAMEIWDFMIRSNLLVTQPNDYLLAEDKEVERRKHNADLQVAFNL